MQMVGKTLLWASVVATVTAATAGRATELEPATANLAQAIAAPKDGLRADSYAALEPGGHPWDDQISIGYYTFTGELWVEARSGARMTSINIVSVAGIFTGDSPLNLGGDSDRATDHNIYRETLDSSFGSLSFGSVAKRYLSERFVLNDLTVTGPLVGGGSLGDVDLIYFPEPSTGLLLGLGLVGLFFAAVSRGDHKRPLEEPDRLTDVSEGCPP